MDAALTSDIQYYICAFCQYGKKEKIGLKTGKANTLLVLAKVMTVS